MTQLHMFRCMVVQEGSKDVPEVRTLIDDGDVFRATIDCECFEIARRYIEDTQFCFVVDDMGLMKKREITVSGG